MHHIVMLSVYDISGRLCQYPVSYTHLDVYKRQGRYYQGHSYCQDHKFGGTVDDIDHISIENAITDLNGKEVR